MTQLNQDMPPLNAPPLSASALLSLNVHWQELAHLYNQDNSGSLKLPPIYPGTSATNNYGPVLHCNSSSSNLLSCNSSNNNLLLLGRKNNNKKRASEVVAATPTPQSNQKQRTLLQKSVGQLSSPLTNWPHPLQVRGQQIIIMMQLLLHQWCNLFLLGCRCRCRCKPFLLRCRCRWIGRAIWWRIRWIATRGWWKLY